MGPGPGVLGDSRSDAGSDLLGRRKDRDGKRIGLPPRALTSAGLRSGELKTRGYIG